MDIDKRIEQLQVWAFVEHNRETMAILRRLKNLTFHDFDGYFLEIWRDSILEYLKNLEKRVMYFFDKYQQAQINQDKRRVVKIIANIFKKGYRDVRDEINSMVVYANDQDDLGPIPA